MMVECYLKEKANQLFAGKHWTQKEERKIFYLEPDKTSFLYRDNNGNRYTYTIVGNRDDFVPNGNEQKFASPCQIDITVETINKTDDQYTNNFNISYDGLLQESFAKDDGTIIPEQIKNLLMLEVFANKSLFKTFPPTDNPNITDWMKEKIKGLIDLFGNQDPTFKVWLETILNGYII